MSEGYGQSQVEGDRDKLTETSRGSQTNRARWTEKGCDRQKVIYRQTETCRGRQKDSDKLRETERHMNIDRKSW